MEDIRPGDRSKEAQEFRKNIRREKWKRIKELEDELQPLLASIRVGGFPCDLCGYASCPYACW